MQEDFDIPEEFEEGILVQPVTPITLNLTKPQQIKNQKKGSINSCRHKTQIGSQEKECTFKPKINTYKSRNLEQFLEFQRGFVQKKQSKLALIKQQLTEKESMELTCKPNIDSNSKRLANRQNEHVFSRLSRERQQQPSVEANQSLLFHPQILGKSKSLSRQDNVAELLYNDAQRRIQKEKITARQSTKKRQIIPKINNNTDRFVLKTIRQEFQDSTKNCASTSPIIALSILSQIFNIDLNPKKNGQTETLCQKVLRFLSPRGCPRGEDGISLIRLWHFIESVMGKPTEEDFSREQQNEIYRTFGHFYRSRMTKTNKQVSSEQYTFQPQILKSSQRLAAKKRERMLTEANAMLTQQNVKVSVDSTQELALADLYILERMHKQQQYHQEKIERESKQLQQCTFTPQILKGERPTSKECLASKQSIAGLNQPHKSFKLKSQNDNTFGTLNTQYSEKERSSFKRSSISRQNKIHEVKDIEKTVQRLSTARKNRQFDRLVKERGYPKDQNWQGFRNSQKKAVQKALRDLKGYNGSRPKRGFVFDVHVGNGIIQSIEVAPGQSPSKVIEAVADKHGFDKSKKGKLLQMMNYHLRNHLNADKENHN